MNPSKSLSKSHEKDKVNHHRAHEDRLRKEGIIDVLFHGRSANPPEDVAKENNLLFKREERRDRHATIECLTTKIMANLFIVL